MTKPIEKTAKPGDPKRPLHSWVKSQTTNAIKFGCEKCSQVMYIGDTDATKFMRILAFWSLVHAHEDAKV